MTLLVLVPDCGIVEVEVQIGALSERAISAPSTAACGLLSMTKEKRTSSFVLALYKARI